jgi:Zn-dependent peptidase ImmA (M78 family)/DNA-binding XRE family transcriptional regulator
MIRVEATPNPALLAWARKSAGMSLEVAAKKVKIKPDQLQSWEEGNSRPSIPQLRKLAATYRRPLAVFYLPETPIRFQVMHDFRRLSPDTVPPEDSPELAFEIRRAYDRREWALELMADIEETPPAFDVKVTRRDDIEEAGTKLRAALRVSVSAQQGWRTDYEAFKQWRLLLERAGMLTFQATDLKLAEARGFSISMRPLPAVVANIKDAPRGRVFTLLHEATHIMLNEGGICDLHDAEVESFCNRVAGATLFPREELLSSGVVRRHKRGDRSWSQVELQEISRQFGGSREAALVRLLTLGLTSQAFYDRKRNEFLEQYQEQRRQAGGFAPPHVIALSSAGPLFTGLVMENFNRERITASDVSDYLQIRLKHLGEVQSEFVWTT